MEFKRVLTFVSVAGAGLITGVVADRIIFNAKQTFGTLKIDKSNPEKLVYSIDVNDFDDLSNKKRVILKVETINK